MSNYFLQQMTTPITKPTTWAQITIMRPMATLRQAPQSRRPFGGISISGCHLGFSSEARLTLPET